MVSFFPLNIFLYKNLTICLFKTMTVNILSFCGLNGALILIIRPLRNCESQVIAILLITVYIYIYVQSVNILPIGLYIGIHFMVNLQINTAAGHAINRVD